MAAFTWYGNQTETEACRFGALAVIFPLIQRMNVIQIINQHCPADPQAEYDYGSILSLLMAARLYSPVALSNVGEWAQDSGADILWDIPPEKLNDDRLGRSLDAFFKERHSILAHLALHAAREFDVPLQEMHYDPPHLLFTGEYENAQAREGVIDRSDKEPTEQPRTKKQKKQPNETKETIRSDSDLAAAHITKGRATDDAPKGSVMVHAGICTMVDEFGPLPFFGHTVDGNQNGRTAVDEQLGLIRKHLQLQPHDDVLRPRHVFGRPSVSVEGHRFARRLFGTVGRIQRAVQKTLQNTGLEDRQLFVDGTTTPPQVGQRTAA